MSIKVPALSCFDSFPAIRRARGYRLYADDGRRYLDLYQDAGRAISGHRPQGLGRQAKSALEKLGTAGLPSHWSKRIDRLLTTHFPDYPYPLRFNSYEELIVSQGISPTEVWDPWSLGYGLEAPASCTLSLWRPFLESPEAEVLLPILPGTGSWGGILALSRTPRPSLGAPLPAFAEAAFERGARLYLESERIARSPEEDSFPDRLWRRIGPYLFPRFPREEYHSFCRQLIAAGIFPSPDYSTPSIVPAEFEPGEVKRLSELEAKWSTES